MSQQSKPPSRFKPGTVPHLLKMAGKGIYGLGIVTERAEGGKCVVCGTAPISKGPFGAAKMCRECGEKSVGAVIDLIGGEDDGDGERGP